MGDTLSLKFTFADPSGNVEIPISGPFLVVAVDWGDGSPISGLSHTYDASGTYTAVVSIFGSATSFGSDGWAGVANLTDVSTNNPVTWGLGSPASVTSFAYLFKGATSLISVPSNVPPSVTNMIYMFTGASSFNQDISGWDVSHVTTMLLMFAGATSFNKNLSAWDVGLVTNTSNMFASAAAFNNGGAALSWGNKTRNFSIMSGMFSGATAFNQDIGDWNVGNATLMEGMFQFASLFNQDISDWNVSNVVNMKLMFNEASAFNQDIGGWDVSRVTTMDQMFQNDASFNQNIRGWAVLSGTNLSNMFNGATAFQTAFYRTTPGYDTDPNTPLYTFFNVAPPPPPPPAPVLRLAVGGGGGAFWFGQYGFLYKRKGGGGARRSTKMAAGGNTTCNGPTYIYNKFKPGGGGVGASSVANRRAKNRLATICGGPNNKCFPCYTTLGQYSNYTHNPNGYVQCPPTPQTNLCLLLPTDTPYQVCSPWPQFGGLSNNQQRRTPITSSQSGNILWQSSNTSNLVTMRTSSPIIANDGTIYIGLIRADETTGEPVACYFAAFNSNGTARWVVPIINGDINDQSSSAIGPDGTNYFVASNDVDNMCYLYAITSSGIILWRTPLPSAVNVSASIAIGNNGEIFVCGINISAEGIIYAVNTSGGIISGYPIVLINEEYVESVITDGPAISRDGNLYVCTFSAVEGNYGLLYSINIITKEVTWTFRIADQGVPQSRPALSSDQSVVYYTFNSSAGISPNYLIAVNSDGSPKWQYATTTYQSSYDTFPQDSMAIGSDGTIYAVINGYANEINETSYGKLVAIDPSTGLAKWTYIFGSVSDITASFVDTSPIIGGDGTIYIGVEIYDVLAISPANPTNIYLTMFAITPAGQLKWKTITTTLNNPGVNDIIYANSPAIGLDGTLYIGTTYSEEADLYVGYSKLYAIK